MIFITFLFIFQVIFDEHWKRLEEIPGYIPKFKSNLGDFQKDAVSVFQRTNVITHWKPVVLLAKTVLNLWCYILVQRDANGIWTIMPYSMLTKDCLDLVQVKITVGSGDRTFIYDGKINSFDSSKEELSKLGQYLVLTDAQIKPFKNPDHNTIFDYDVEVLAKPEILARMNKSLVDLKKSKDLNEARRKSIDENIEGEKRRN